MRIDSDDTELLSRAVEIALELVSNRARPRRPPDVDKSRRHGGHGSPVGKLAHEAVGLLPKPREEKVMATAGTDRLAALHLAIQLVRRRGTISLSGVYGGTADPLPMLTLFDKQIQLRMGQANVKHWVPEVLPLLSDDDPLGTDDFATHHVSLEQAPEAYEMFQTTRDGAVKVLFRP